MVPYHTFIYDGLIAIHFPINVLLFNKAKYVY